MNLNSPLFDRIRVKRTDPEPRPAADGPRCDHPACAMAAEYRAPKGRLREGQFYSFCLAHVREYNQTYNYFRGMSDGDVAEFQKEAIIGHRPTWSMGARSGPAWTSSTPDPANPFTAFRRRPGRGGGPKPQQTRVTIVGRKALAVLGLDESADAPMIRARYTDLVKRLHPDANNGDRSREEKLREIIHAYKQLRSAKLV